MYGPKWPYLLGYGSRDTRRIDFPRVDGSSTDTPVLGRHIVSGPFCGHSICHTWPQGSRVLFLDFEYYT